MTIFFFGDVEGAKVDVAKGRLGRLFFESSKIMRVRAGWLEQMVLTSVAC